jgi:hypothetical protein
MGLHGLSQGYLYLFTFFTIRPAAWCKSISKYFLCRIEGQHSVSASNAFKLDKWHSLFLSKKHSPIDLTEEEFLDLFNTSLKWFKKANSVDKESW